MKKALSPLVSGLALALPGLAPGQVMTVQELLALPRPAADHRVAYGEHPSSTVNSGSPPATDPSRWWSSCTAGAGWRPMTWAMWPGWPPA